MEKILIKHADKLRFGIVGGANTAIDIGILFSLVNFLKLPIIYSNIISTSVALIFSYFANKKFTFKHKDQNTRKQIITFFGITLIGLWILQPIIITLVGALLFYLSFDKNIVLFIGKIIATCVTLVWNYLLYRRFVFKKQLDI